MVLFRSVLYTIIFYTMTALFLLLGSWLLLAPRRWAMAGLKAHARTCVWALRWVVGIDLVVRGQENVPAGGCLVAAKHQSAWDTFGLVPLFDDPAIIMKAELMWIPFYGWFSHKFGMIAVARDTGPSALRDMVRAAKARLADDRQIVIFPEGTRRAPGAEPDYKSGILLMYDRLKVPCVPVALNSGVMWPRRSIMRYPGTIVVEILPAIPPGLARKDFAHQLQTAIETATARLVAEAANARKPEAD